MVSNSLSYEKMKSECTVCLWAPVCKCMGGVGCFATVCRPKPARFDL